MFLRIRRAIKRDDGLTLLAVLAVMVIMGILAALVIPFLSKKKQVAGNGTSTPAPKPESAKPAGEPFTVNWSIVGLVILAVVAIVLMVAVATAMYRVSANKRSIASKLSDRWTHALDKHNAIRDEYASLSLDPVKSLQHSALWDVTNDRTRKFHEVYAEVQDIASLWGTKQPTDEVTITRYEKALRVSAIAWDSAVKHSARLGYDWMNTEDKSAARRAVGLLDKSRDLSATESERSLSAAKAKELINTIGSVFLPKETHAAIDNIARGMLTAA